MRLLKKCGIACCHYLSAVKLVDVGFIVNEVSFMQSSGLQIVGPQMLNFEHICFFNWNIMHL